MFIRNATDHYLFAVVLLTGSFASASGAEPVIPVKDFAEYWSAGRVHLTGGNPYDGRQLLPLQREAYGEPDLARPVMLWTPPWTLPLYWPFAALPVRDGHALWLFAQVGMTAVACGLLWRTYRGSLGPGGLAAALLIPIGFAPVWWMVGYGQNTGFLAFGLAGFAYCRFRNWPWLAGAFVALTALKPHVLALFGLALLLDGFTRRGWRTLAGGAAALAGLSVLAMIPDPRVFAHFADAITGPPTAETVPVSHWNVPTLGYRLRWLIAGTQTLKDTPGELFWVQWIPIALGVAVLLPYWWHRRADWDWVVETPRLVAASVLLAPYGAWIFDLTVLLVPVIQTAARVALANRPVGGAFGAVGLLAASFATFDKRLVGMLHDMYWFAPVILGLCVAVNAMVRPADPRPEP